MAQKSWPWSTVAGLGDGSAELSEAITREFLAVYFAVQDPATEGVSKGVGGELAVSGSASPLSVASGSGVCYGLYINDAAVNTAAIATPAIGTTGGRVVLQTNWGGTGGASLEARTRVAVKMSADGNSAIPALTQSFGTTWEISLATFQITTGGAITVTDDRTFRKATTVTVAGGLEDGVALAEILDDDGAGSGLDADLLDGNHAAAFAVAAKGVTNGDSHDHNGGDGAAIPAGGLADGAVNTTAKLADGIVTAGKIANRTRTIWVPGLGSTTSITGGNVASLAGSYMPDSANQNVPATFAVPADFVSDMTITPIVRATAAGDLAYHLILQYAANGENYSIHADTFGSGGSPIIEACGNDQIKELTARAFTAIAAGDYVQIELRRYANPGTGDTIVGPVYCLGFKISYTADS